MSSTWYKLEPNASNLDNIFKFTMEQPRRIRELVSAENSNFFTYIELFASPITQQAFLYALDESVVAITSDLDRIRKDIDINKEIFRIVNNILDTIGFSGYSLRIKIDQLNYLWELVLRSLQRTGQTVIDFGNNSLVKVLRRFLNYLNSILGSLSKLIPGADGIKEIKDLLESYLELGNDLR